MSFWDWLASTKGELLLAGLAGAVVSAVTEWNGWRLATRKVVVGVICALYLWPLALPLLGWALGALHIPQENAVSLSGFVMGMIGIIVIEIILKAFRLRRDDLGRSSE